MNKLFLAISVCSITVTLNSYGQIQNSQSFNNDSTVFSERISKIGEVVISGFRVDRKVKDLPAPISVIRHLDYQKQSSLTLSNALDREPGISMGGDGIWSTNINIRGLSENRLVTLIDGSRVETATDLAASMSMTDVWEIDRVEVIKGAQSSLYGTGAMGGIVNIITKNGHFSDKPYLSGNIGSGFASANTLYSGHGDLEAGSRKWHMRIGGTYANADDIRTPDGEMPNSQYKYNNFTTRFGYKPFKNHVLGIQYQQYQASDVGIPGGDAFPGPAEATYTDIGRYLLSANYEITDISEKLKSVKFAYFNQYIDRNVSLLPNTVTEATLPNGNKQRTTPDLMTPNGRHLTNGGQVQTTWDFSPNNTFIVGADIWSRKLSTDRTKYITIDIINPAGTVIKTNFVERGETPIPESSLTSTGIFFQDEARLYGGKLTVISGGRLDGIQVRNKEGFDVDYIIMNGVENNSPVRRITFEEGTENSISWSANAGLLFKASGKTDLSLNLARSYRAPSLEERFKYIDLGNYVRLGDPALKPESGLSADMGVRTWGKAVNFRMDFFINRLSNMIVEAPGDFIYTTITGTALATDTLPAFINSNVSKALLYGFDTQLEYNIAGGFVLNGSVSYTRGKDTEAKEDLPLIPPLRGRLGIRYTHNKAGTLELSAAGAAKQEKIAAGEEVTEGYVRLDLSLNSNRIALGKTGLQIFAGIDNITDTRYTNHLSTNRGSISIEPGRNAFLRIIFSF